MKKRNASDFSPLLPGLLLLLFLFAGGCAQGAPAGQNETATSGLPSLDEDDEYLDSAGAYRLIPDPLEPWNRFWFTFNDYTYEYVLRPLHSGYSLIVPQPARQGIGNFFHNLRAPIRIVNNMLQGRGNKAGAELSSFLINSTVGLGGLIDVVKKEREAVVKDDEDGGQTLGVWGMGEGFYIVWPLIGPSNVRDSLGLGMDVFLTPETYILDSWKYQTGLAVFREFNEFDKLLDHYNAMKGMSVEPYTSLRDAYTQYRRGRIAK